MFVKLDIKQSKIVELTNLIQQYNDGKKKI